MKPIAASLGPAAERLAERAAAEAERGVDVGPFALEPARDPAQLRADAWRQLVPRRLWPVDLERWDAMPEVADPLRGWAADPAGRNLVILGPIGVGKTTAALGACGPRFAAGEGVHFVPWDEAADAMRDELAAGGGRSPVLAELLSVDVLVLDDVGQQALSEWSAGRLYQVLNRRWLDELPSVVTSNVAPENLSDAIGPRSFSRLVGGAVVLRIAGDDRRRARR